MTNDAAKDIMLCPRCDETLEPGALFCGNCGQAILQSAGYNKQVAASSPSPPLPPTSLPPSQMPLQAPHGPPAAGTTSKLPLYAQTNPAQRKTEPRAMVAIIAGVLSLPAAFIPLFGVAMATVAVVIATKARRTMSSKTLPNVAVGFAVAGAALSIGVHGYIVSHQNQQTSKGRIQATRSQSDEPVLIESRTSGMPAATESKKLDTPCYVAVLPLTLQAVLNTADSCAAQAFDNNNAEASRNALAINATKQADLTAANFVSSAQEAASTYADSSLPGFTITGRNGGSFAGSQAYYVEAQKSDGGNSTSNVQLALVYHPTGHGENLFVLVQVVNDSKAGLADIEKAWKWK